MLSYILGLYNILNDRAPLDKQRNKSCCLVGNDNCVPPPQTTETFLINSFFQLGPRRHIQGHYNYLETQYFLSFSGFILSRTSFARVGEEGGGLEF